MVILHVGSRARRDSRPSPGVACSVELSRATGAAAMVSNASELGGVPSTHERPDVADGNGSNSSADAAVD